MADSYVCSGAIMQCSLGTATSILKVYTDRTINLCAMPMANIDDHRSENIPSFGVCLSTAIPTPCTPLIPFPWEKGRDGYLLRNHPALLKSSTCHCMRGGTISIVDDGQHGEGTMWVQKQPMENHSHEELQLVEKTIPRPHKFSVAMPNQDTIASQHTQVEAVITTEELELPAPKNNRPQSLAFENSQQKSDETRYKLLLKDAYWEKDGMKIRFIPHQEEKSLKLVFVLIKDSRGDFLRDLTFRLKFDIPDTFFPQQGKLITIKFCEMKDVGIKDEKGNNLYYCKIDDFSSDLSKVRFDKDIKE